jgi:hypothetical protein
MAKPNALNAGAAGTKLNVAPPSAPAASAANNAATAAPEGFLAFMDGEALAGTGIKVKHVAGIGGVILLLSLALGGRR